MGHSKPVTGVLYLYLNFLEPLCHSRPVTGLLYLYLYLYLLFHTISKYITEKVLIFGKDVKPIFQAPCSHVKPVTVRSTVFCLSSLLSNNMKVKMHRSFDFACCFVWGSSLMFPIMGRIPAEGIRKLGADKGIYS